MTTADQVLNATRIAADLLLALAPDDAAQHLSDAAVRRANAIVDTAEALKFGNAPTEPSER